MRPQRAIAARAVLCGLAALAGGPADAHTGTGLAGGFNMGFIHPITGIDHLLAMISVGLWGAVLGRPLIYALPIVFPAVMVLGAVLGMFAIPVPSVELGIALSVVVLGTSVAMAVRAPIWAAALITGGFALFHGYAHGRELPSAADPLGYSAGFVLATGLLHVFGIGVGFVNECPGGAAVTRCIGGLIGSAGVWFLIRATTS
ncbi:MAG TPA: HupE/UreJ family protein [Steroidobacteraceae bacterium]